MTTSPAAKALSISTFRMAKSLPKRVVKAALGNAPVQRHLAALKTGAARKSLARFLTLVAGSGGLAQLRADAPANAHLAVARAARADADSIDVTAMLASIPGYENLRSLHDDDQVAHLVHHAADGGRVFALDNLVQAAQAEPAHRLRAYPGCSR